MITHFFQPLEIIDSNRAKKKELLFKPINSLIQLKNLSIQVLEEFSTTPMSFNLLIFKGTRHKNPSVYIEHFIVILTTYLIMDGHYYLMWFSTTLKKRAYK